jgi:hypothetical protein
MFTSEYLNLPLAQNENRLRHAVAELVRRG